MRECPKAIEKKLFYTLFTCITAHFKTLYKMLIGNKPCASMESSWRLFIWRFMKVWREDWHVRMILTNCEKNMCVNWINLSIWVKGEPWKMVCELCWSGKEYAIYKGDRIAILLLHRVVYRWIFPMVRFHMHQPMLHVLMYYYVYGTWVNIP